MGDRGGTVFIWEAASSSLPTLCRELYAEKADFGPKAAAGPGDSTVDALLGARLFIEVELAGPVHRRWPQWAFGFDQKRRAFEALRSV